MSELVQNMRFAWTIYYTYTVTFRVTIFDIYNHDSVWTVDRGVPEYFLAFLGGRLNLRRKYLNLKPSKRLNLIVDIGIHAR
jgi:hypothetical protein